uniref:CYP74A88 n=1 Tax=Ranunculus japonicus TaxID=286919 RepID=A0A4P8ULL7_9MAGN|nr:CYP74A88 [Ranunculus japonicus]
MATSTSLVIPPLQFHRGSKRRGSISASISETSTNTPSIPSITITPTTKPPSFPIQKIPEKSNFPFITPVKDRLDYFYFQGREDFFKSRIQTHRSTVFRANMPPGPFISQDPNVIVLLDAKSFPVLFDTSKVEKKDVFTGTYTPSLELTGGYRTLSYLDPSEPNHAKLKSLLFFQLKSAAMKVIPEFRSTFATFFDEMETELGVNGKAKFNDPCGTTCFNFLARSLYNTNPADTKFDKEAPGIIKKWILFQLSPVLTLGLPWLIEDLLIHQARLPPALIKSSYAKLYDFFYQSSGPILDEAEKIGISRDEACHNLIFSTCFNAYGGMKILFPNMVKQIGRAGAKLHRKLAEEIRSVVRSNGGKITMAGMEQMPLMKSVVYESFRIEPPVPLQYGRAKKDFVIESHVAAFEVKEGEVLFGYQPFATRDPKIFEKSEDFVPDRFMGEEGEKLLKYVFWSNGRETESPSVDNKQCAGKDFVVLVSRLLVVELFLRYDTFDIEVKKSALGAAVTLTSLKR